MSQSALVRGGLLQGHAALLLQRARKPKSAPRQANTPQIPQPSEKTSNSSSSASSSSASSSSASSSSASSSSASSSRPISKLFHVGQAVTYRRSSAAIVPAEIVNVHNDGTYDVTYMVEGKKHARTHVIRSKLHTRSR